MCFDNEINTTIYSKYSQTCLSELQPTGMPAIRNKLLRTDFPQRSSPLWSRNLAVRHRLGNLGTDMSYQHPKYTRLLVNTKKLSYEWSEDIKSNKNQHKWIISTRLHIYETLFYTNDG